MSIAIEPETPIPATHANPSACNGFGPLKICSAFTAHHRRNDDAAASFRLTANPQFNGVFDTAETIRSTRDADPLGPTERRQDVTETSVLSATFRRPITAPQSRRNPTASRCFGC
ncbi:hypothetical protein [Nocardia jiangxiensis]|uniref:hypothetical protein n=1 Tax=Nocardia jiangxiensis TaxID=282685 RepID=UPI0012F68AE4|nr:hypothetical protein [Nocardia jiangxiensis]